MLLYSLLFSCTSLFYLYLFIYLCIASGHGQIIAKLLEVFDQKNFFLGTSSDALDATSSTHLLFILIFILFRK